MAILSINPTRMELQSLKAKLATSRRGHKLLKDKCDELMRRFMAKVRENRVLRVKVEKELSAVQNQLLLARSTTGGKVLDTALSLPKQELNLEIRPKNVMSVMIPELEARYKAAEDDIFSYGYAFTSTDMDEAIAALSHLLPKMVRLAEVEKSCQLLAAEIEKTRRRVNALEHVMIPDYEDTIRYITMKLDENERSTTTRLMKVKDMMLKQTRAQ